ncbi:MAG: aminopeptidase P family protein, partial [Planctomycetota bacterium]
MRQEARSLRGRRRLGPVVEGDMSAGRVRIPSPYRDRIARVREELLRRKLDGYLICDRMDQIWLTGFTGEDGAVLITDTRVVLLTDGRFDETADREAPWARKVLRKQRTPDVTARELRRYRLSRVGFDPRRLDVATYAGLRPAAKPTRLVAVANLIGGMRLIKDAGEVEKIRRAIRIAERVFKRVAGRIRPGMSERAIAAKLVYEMQAAGAQGPSFPPIVAVGANGSLPHYEPGDAQVSGRHGVLIDWGARCDWYVSDLTRMVWPGSV